jgi:hypothetical protein
MGALLHKWLSLPAREKALAVEVVALLAYFRLGLKSLPLKELLRLLDWSAPAAPWRGAAPPEYLAQVSRQTEAAGARFLHDGPCLTQALAALWLLKIKGIPARLVIGVDKTPGGSLIAHAWVESEGAVVTGGPAEALKKYARLPDLNVKPI